MIELAENAAAQLTGSKSKLVKMPLARRRSRASASRTSPAPEKTLGWEPKVKLEDGLKETIAYFRRIADA